MKLNIRQTADLLGYNSNYFTNRRKQVEGFGPPSIEMGGKTLFDLGAVLRWADENGKTIDIRKRDELLKRYQAQANLQSMDMFDETGDAQQLNALADEVQVFEADELVKMIDHIQKRMNDDMNRIKRALIRFQHGEDEREKD